MDITPLFRACVKTVKTRKTFLAKEHKDRANVPATNILKSNRSNFYKLAKSLLTTIRKLLEFLHDNKQDYLGLLHNRRDQMTDVERAQIDTDMQANFDTCIKLIGELATHVSKDSSAQFHSHAHGMISYLELYLRHTIKFHGDMRTIRIKRSLEKQKMSKIERKTNDVKVISRNIPEAPAPVIENKLSPEEIQMFESENEQLLEELNIVDETVHQIEKKVVHISELQNVFCEKVLEQEKDIERISTAAITSTENMRDANEQIRQAIQRNAGLRVWLLFFLIVMSLSLLFLDWYND